MTSRVTHTVKAVIRVPNARPRHVLVGRATTDEQDRVAICIDALPRDLSNWTGWLNLFPVDENRSKDKGSFSDFDDDIPF